MLTESSRSVLNTCSCCNCNNCSPSAVKRFGFAEQSLISSPHLLLPIFRSGLCDNRKKTVRDQPIKLHIKRTYSCQNIMLYMLRTFGKSKQRFNLNVVISVGPPESFQCLQSCRGCMPCRLHRGHICTSSMKTCHNKWISVQGQAV